MRVTQANHVWALDTMYIPTERGFVYLTAVVDVASRQELAHKVAIALEMPEKTQSLVKLRRSRFFEQSAKLKLTG